MGILYIYYIVAFILLTMGENVPGIDIKRQICDLVKSKYQI